MSIYYQKPFDDTWNKSRIRIFNTCWTCGKETDVTNLGKRSVECPHCGGWLIKPDGSQKYRFYTPEKREKLPERVFIRRWGIHPNGVIKLFYEGGAYAKQIKMEGNKVMFESEIKIETKSGNDSIEDYISENKYEEVKADEKDKQIKKRNR
jgi:DNA-directed RNA polymerase subunit RPC12/RpoP